MPRVLNASEFDSGIDVPSLMVFRFSEFKDAERFFNSQEVEAAYVKGRGEEGTWGISADLAENEVSVRFLPPLDPAQKFKDPVKCLHSFAQACACCESELPWAPHGKDAIIRGLVERAQTFDSYTGAEEMPCPFFVPEINKAPEFAEDRNIIMFPVQGAAVIVPEPLEG